MKHLNQYINWSEIWDKEVDLGTSIDNLEESPDDETRAIIIRFMNDKNLELMVDDCYVQNDNLIFFFSESGGQNESDPDGWSRDYTFILDSDFFIIKAEYSQG